MTGSTAGAHDLSTAVITTVADAEGTDPSDLPQPLHDVIDPDALDQLFRDRPAADGHVRFRFHGYDVTARSDGTVTLDDPAHDGPG